MKKTLYLTAILIIGFTLNTFAQDTTQITFSANYDEEHLSLDSILIMNLTQGGDTVLYWPDTVLILHIDSGGMNVLDPSAANRFSVSQNYPNPIADNTFIDVSIEKRDNIEIQIYDLVGRVHASYKSVLDAGKHTFTFYPGNADFYIFSASYHGLTRSIKIVNLESARQYCKLAYKGYGHHAVGLKSQQDGGFPFEQGDNLRYIGYAWAPAGNFGVRGSDVIEDIPEFGNTAHYQFDISLGVPCVNIPTVHYEGENYNTVQIGTQCWLKENLRIGTMVPGVQEQTDNDTLEKYCYSNDLDLCEKYGGLYQWNEAMNYSMYPGVRGICPPGWHIPTDEEFKQLEGTVDTYYSYPDTVWDQGGWRGYDVGTRLKSADTWYDPNGTNDYGFSALATGSRFVDGTFWSVYNYTSFWTSNFSGGIFVWYRYLQNQDVGSCRTAAPNNMGRSVRCLRNN